jgi:hypothetical protein
LRGSVVAKVTLEDAVKSATPYLDVFGEDVRKRGRPAGSNLDYDTSLEMPSAKVIPDRRLAKQVRDRVQGRAVAVVSAVMAEELKRIYKAELALELARIGAEYDGGRPEPIAPRGHASPVPADQARQMPGSGFEPGQTYWEWMKTYNDKTDEQWAAEKKIVQKNISRIVKGTNHG